MVPFENMLQLAAAARKGRDAHVQTWILPGMAHVNGIVQDRSEYIQRIVTFFQKALN
jgi:dipeptidyl aminopeptidase/acylaminoacyl peptidase